MDCVHELRLAPTKSMLDVYKKHGGSWSEYERQFLGLLAERQIESVITPATLENSVFLCSDAEPSRCHRRLVTDCLAARWEDVRVEHL